MKKIALKIKYRLMSNNMLLILTNKPSFSELEQKLIGEELNRRFKTDEEIEKACSRVLG